MTGGPPPQSPAADLVRQGVLATASALRAVVALWTVDPHGSVLRACAAADGTAAGPPVGVDEAVGAGPAEPLPASEAAGSDAWLVATPTGDAQTDLHPAYARFARDVRAGSLAVAPVPGGGGLLVAGRREPAAPLTAEDLGLLTERAAGIAAAVQALHTQAVALEHRALLDATSDAVVATDAQGRITLWNRAAEVLYGVVEEDALGRAPADLVSTVWYEVADGAGGWRPQPPEDASAVLLDSGQWRGRVRQRRRDGGIVLVEGRTTVRRDVDGRYAGLVSVNRDVTALVDAERSLENSRRTARTLLDASPAASVVVDRSGRIRSGSSAWYRLLADLGHDEPSTLRDWFDRGDDAAPALAAVEGVLAGRRAAAHLAVEFTDPTGEPRPMHGQVVGLVDAGEAVLALVPASSHAGLERRLAHRARHDALTGLPNRSALLEALNRALTRAARLGTGVGVAFCDLDRFKDVNDSVGHDAGDRVLQEAARRMGAAARGHELLARFGGDEFVVVVEDVLGPDEVLPLADRILRAFRAPIVVDGHESVIGVSIGVAVSGGGGHEQAETLLSEADTALYEAKDTRRGRAVVFQPHMRERIQTRLDLAAGLRRAVGNGELELVYQPVAGVDDGHVGALEAFVRWRHPGRGLLGPAAFLAAAEESGAIIGMGEWVLDRALAQLAAWGERVDPGLVMALNLSARQLADPELVLTVAEALDRHGISPDRLHLEFTEDALLADAEGATATLARLAGLGIGLVVDDFGSGMSSLARLESVPLRALKVDPLLTGRADREPRAQALLRAVCSLGHSLGLVVVAEGVESASQREAVRDAGCDAYQGFLLCRPLVGDGVLDWLHAHRST